MTAALFVHGTGVRTDAYEESFGLVADALRTFRLSAQRCYWGGLGSELHADGASIPRYDATRAIAGVATPEDTTIALWAMLYDDPLYELRMLGLRRGGRGERAMGQVAPGLALAEAGTQLVVSDALRALLAKGGIEHVFESARLSVMASPTSRAAFNAAPEALGEDRAALARAIIAKSLALAIQPAEPTAKAVLPRAASDRTLRDEIEHALVDALGGAERGIGGWVSSQLIGLASRLGSTYLARRRGSVTDAAFPAAGDILLYQSRGQGIGDFIRGELLKLAAPRIVVAHSLGGIACVDLLASQDLGVDLLVTVGSQAPFLYEIDALRSLRYGEPLPVHFPRWLNIYDLRDFLSYIGGTLFPGKVHDVQVDNGQPFPVSHSAYWTNPKVWKAVGEAIA
jgi:hypothetical protein